MTIMQVVSKHVQNWLVFESVAPSPPNFKVCTSPQIIISGNASGILTGYQY